MKTEFRTPRWIDLLIDNLAPHHLAEEIRGDLYELYLNDIRKNGINSAKRKYVLNGLGFLVKNFFWKGQGHTNQNPYVMLISYFKMARRSLLAHKATTFINILGLVTGIASALVIMTVIRFELSFDTFHSDRDRIYRMIRVSGNDMSEFSPGISFPVPRAIETGIPSVGKVASVEYFGGAYVDILDPSGSSNKQFREESGFALVDKSFFEVFDFKGVGLEWISGSPEKSLLDPFDIVLTQTMAKKYFGNENPIGRTIKLQQKYDCKVTGVTEDLPANTDFPFTVFISYASIPTLSTVYNDWFAVNSSHHVYLLLTPGTTQSAVENQISKLHAAHTPKDIHESRKYLLQNLSDVHHDSRVWNFNRRSISKETLIGLGLVAAFLLLTASINYINLTTAQSVLRAKEIGVRKTMGGDRRNVVLQFLLETFIIVFLAGLAALGVASLILMNFQSLLNIPVDGFTILNTYTITRLTLIIVSITILAGFYPAVVMSRFSPVTALKNRFATEKWGGIGLRKVLLVMQFTMTQVLVVGAYIVVNQMEYFNNVNMGFNKEGIINARVPNRDPAVTSTLGNTLREQAFVKNVSFSSTLPSGVKRNRSYADIARPEAVELKEYIMYESVAVDPSYLDVYQIELLAGRNLNHQDPTSNVLVNNALCKNLNLGKAGEVVGKQVKINDGRMLTIVGVIGDYFGNSLKEDVDNIVMMIDPAAYSTVSVKLDVGNGDMSLADAISGTEEAWTRAFPEYLFTYQFFDDNIEAFYVQERKYAMLFNLFAIIFLVIGCLGLFGLITFTVNRKGKEVAIRKVLGASISSILLMFSKGYVSLIALSFLLAAPVAHYLTDEWLSKFANRIPLGWWLFVLPGMLVLLVAILVICAKSLRLARTNPVQNLKCE